MFHVKQSRKQSRLVFAENLFPKKEKQPQRETRQHNVARERNTARISTTSANRRSADQHSPARISATQRGSAQPGADQRSPARIGTTQRESASKASQQSVNVSYKHSRSFSNRLRNRLSNRFRNRLIGNPVLSQTQRQSTHGRKNERRTRNGEQSEKRRTGMFHVKHSGSTACEKCCETTRAHNLDAQRKLAKSAALPHREAAKRHKFGKPNAGQAQS